MFLKEKKCRIKKLRFCHGCCKKMKVNEIMHKTTCINEGEFNHFYICENCKQFENKICVHCKVKWQCENEWSGFRGFIKDCRIQKGINEI